MRGVVVLFFRGKRWQDMEYFDPKWTERIREMAKYITRGKSVIDLGCGKMWLKEYLHENPYFPVDYISRGDDTIICDFNKKQFPNIQTDIAFVSGALEYVVDTSWFVSEISMHSRECILSYCLKENFSDINFRKKQAWVNNFSRNEIVDLFRSFGFVLNSENTTTSKNSIFYFVINN